MTGDEDTPPPPPSTTSADKLIPFNITNKVPVKLDLEKHNYNSWSSFFKIHLGSLGLKSHVETEASSSTINPEWCKLDGLIKMWILGSLCDSLQEQVVSTPGNAKALWDHLKDLFHDNKDARAINLDNELRSIKIGTLSINEYCTKIKAMADRLRNFGSVVSEKNLVIYAVNGLDSRFATIVKIIRHREPLPTFETARNMLLLEESTLNDQAGTTTTFESSSSSPTVLMATNNSANKGTPNTSSNESSSLPQLFNHFNKGTCKFGERCKFIHDHRNRVGLNFKPNSNNTPNSTRQPGNLFHNTHASWAFPGAHQARLAQQQTQHHLINRTTQQQPTPHAYAAPLYYPVTSAHYQPVAQQTTQQAIPSAQYPQPLNSPGLLGPAPALYPSQPTSLPSAFKNISDSDRTVEYNNSTNQDSDFNLDDAVEFATRSPKVRKDLDVDNSDENFNIDNDIKGYHVISEFDDEEMKLPTSNGPIENFVEKIQRSFNNINLEMASISPSLKEGLPRFPLCDSLKKLLEEFKNGISSNAFMEEDDGCDDVDGLAENYTSKNSDESENHQMDEEQTDGEQDSAMTECEEEVRVGDSIGDFCDDVDDFAENYTSKNSDKSQPEANSPEKINAESQDRTQDESTNEVEKPIEDKSKERQNNSSTGFEKKNVEKSDDDDEKDEDEETRFEKKNDDDDLGFENSDDDDLGFEKKNENENKNSDADGFKNVSKEEINENEKNNESQSTEEVFETGHGSPSKDEEIKAKEDKELDRIRDDNDSFENKLKMDKLSQNVDLLERILSDINSEITICSSKIPDNPRLKEIKAKFNNCIRNEYLSGQDTMNKEEFENDETMGFERESQELNEEKVEDEETRFEKKNDDDDLGFENSDDDGLGFEKKNENENKNSDADGFKNVSKEEVNENEKNNESQSTKEVFETGHGSQSKDEEIKAKEDKELDRIQKRKQSENELDRRQKQRVEEIRKNEKKIKKAYKQALLTFHPDRVPKDDLHKQVEAEEIFKIIQRKKDRKEPNIIII
ncbi:hybrid signal transduction histidine kinase M [Artemisia annua]|uniref:Hybrid signal transduction histidine kinase M n=1 Tax=Artemisia annua TaxID=35608 RepID=A0A2U1Q005_ARTAN|nr:hybrid signal transduction histidine kinase M [Artemisia annua]